MLFTAAQLFAHLVGDYLLQNSWMAARKTQSSAVALTHALVYILPFLLITRAPIALAIMVASHFLIDRYRLARYVIWARDHLAPKWTYIFDLEQRDTLTADGMKKLPHTFRKPVRCLPWANCKNTGFDGSIDKTLTTWLLIIIDNVIHVGINALAIYLFG